MGRNTKAGTILWFCFCLLLASGMAIARDGEKPHQNGGMEGYVKGIDSAGGAQPVKGALIELFGVDPATGDLTITPVASTHSNERGFYSFRELKPAPYGAMVTAAGYQDLKEMITISPGQVLKKNFLLRPGSVPTPTPTGTPPSLSTLRGTVFEADAPTSIPIPEAHIMVYHYWTITADWNLSGINPFFEAFTDINGKYEIKGIPEGEYAVMAAANNYRHERVIIKINQPELVQDFSLKKWISPTPSPTPVPCIITVGHDTSYDFQTITEALQNAKPKCRVLVADDEYSTDTGEIFPLLVPAGIILKRMDDTTLPVIRGDKKNPVIKCHNIAPETRTIIEGFLITGGYVEKDVGGGVLCMHASPAFISCIITGNTALAGAGVMCMGGAPLFYGCEIIDNTSLGGYGGGIRCQQYGSESFLDAKFVNCLIAGNTVTGNGRGGGVYCSSGNLTMLSCTVADNEAHVASGVFSWLQARIHIVNSIIWGNVRDNALQEGTDSKLSIIYSCVEGGFPGEGNIDQDPLFDASNGYRLTNASPCIDKGLNKLAPPTDLDGMARPFDGDGDGIAVVDMGCYELGSIPPTPTPTATPVQKGLLYGTVVEDPGLLTVVPPPIHKAHVAVYKITSSGDGGTDPGIRPFRETWTNEKGEYRIPDLPFDKYAVKCEARGFETEKTELLMNADKVEQNFKLKKKIQPTVTPTPTPWPAGAIYGIVMGIDASTSKPIPLAGALVEVFPPVDCEPGADCIVAPVARAITDEKGFYLIEKVPAGIWEVVARARGFLPDVAPVTIRGGDRVEQNFLLKPGIQPRPGSIFGKVMGLNIDSTILPGPIQGAKVEVFDAPVTNDAGEIQEGLRDPVAVVFTNRDGEYKIIDLPANRLYMVRASARDFYPEHKSAVIYDRPVEVNFLLKPLPQPTPTPAGGVIRGRVVEAAPDGSAIKPIGGAKVTIKKRIHWDGDSYKPDAPPIVVYTDRSGYYKAEKLGEGHYHMDVLARGYHPKFRHVHLRENEIKVVHFALRPISPTPTPPPQNGDVFGHVYAMTPDPTDRPTTPISGALVILYQVRSDTNSWQERKPVARAKTDSDGLYEIKGVPSGPYIIVAEALGFRRGIKHVIIPVGDKARVNFALKPDIIPTPTPVPDHGSVEGLVLGIKPNGHTDPIPGARVLLYRDTSIVDHAIPGSVRQAITDDQGKFFMDKIRPGDYMVMARACGFEPATKPVTVEKDKTSSVVLELKPMVSPTPPPPPDPGAIEGHVSYEKDGALIPIPSAGLMAVLLRTDTSDTLDDLMGDRPVKHTATDEFGFYRFEDMRPGKYMVLAKAQGFKKASSEGEVKSLETYIMDFILEKRDDPTTDTGTIFGHVMTIDFSTTGGQKARIPLENVQINVLRMIDTLDKDPVLIPAGSAVTDDSGAYLVDNLPHGIYVVIAEKEEYSTGIKKARVRHICETRVDFLLFPLSHPRPDPTDEVVYDGEFEFSDEDWKPAGAPDFFLMPGAKHENGRINLSSSDNLNTFGYWYSPGDAVPVEAGTIYKAGFAISGDIPDPADSPCVRLRVNSQNEQVCDMIVINSLGSNSVSPDAGGRIYTMYFTLPNQDILPPEPEDDLYISFDLVNLDDRDAANAKISLDWVKIESLPEESIPDGVEVASFDFGSSSNGWSNQFAEKYFTPPTAISAPSMGALALKAQNNTDTFGTWVSPVSVIPIQSDMIYRIEWKIFSDQLDSETAPGIRIRAADEENRYIVQKCIFSNSEGDNSPDTLGRTYTLFYAPQPELAGAGMTLAMDMVNFDTRDAAVGTIGVSEISIIAIPSGNMP